VEDLEAMVTLVVALAMLRPKAKLQLVEMGKTRAALDSDLVSLAAGSVKSTTTKINIRISTHFSTTSTNSTLQIDFLPTLKRLL